MADQVPLDALRRALARSVVLPERTADALPVQAADGGPLRRTLGDPTEPGQVDLDVVDSVCLRRAGAAGGDDGHHPPTGGAEHQRRVGRRCHADLTDEYDEQLFRGRVYGAEPDEDPGPEPGHEYRELLGGRWTASWLTSPAGTSTRWSAGPR
ncbi:hypothetical protein [Kitasatospora sp. NPDC048407]|uniref:hypothetical protein n=1 Tax=Kitasatospora sp. NPDC048407 TaxID=3364051 RepID=UPI00371074E4